MQLHCSSRRKEFTTAIRKTEPALRAGDTNPKKGPSGDVHVPVVTVLDIGIVIISRDLASCAKDDILEKGKLQQGTFFSRGMTFPFAFEARH
jgi:hypothetical protein